MTTLKVIYAKGFGKCCCCSGTWRNSEKYFQVLEDNKPVKGERYCSYCEKYAKANNNIK